MVVHCADITTLVCSGGMASFVTQLGVLQALMEHHGLSRDHITETVSTSSGCITVLLFCLLTHYTWLELHDFVTQRPWHNTVGDMDVVVSGLFDGSQGLLPNNLWSTWCNPLFHHCDPPVPTWITLAEWKDRFGIDMKFIATDVNQSCTVVLSSDTFPTMPVLHAIRASTAVPVLFPPVFVDSHCFVDGGIRCNYPLAYSSLSSSSSSSSSSVPHVLGLHNAFLSLSTRITPDTPLIEFLMRTLYVVTSSTTPIPNIGTVLEITIPVQEHMWTLAWDAWCHKETRERLWSQGTTMLLG